MQTKIDFRMEFWMAISRVPIPMELDANEMEFHLALEQSLCF